MVVPQGMSYAQNLAFLPQVYGLCEWGWGGGGAVCVRSVRVGLLLTTSFTEGLLSIQGVLCLGCDVFPYGK